MEEFGGNVIDLGPARRRRKEAQENWAADPEIHLEVERDLDGPFMTVRTETRTHKIEQSLDRSEAHALALVLLNFARSSPHVEVGGGIAWTNKEPAPAEAP